MNQGIHSVQVSVLVTYYNQKQYVREALDSILRQKTNFNFEVLLGDDGSDDGTYELLLDYEKQYAGVCKVYRHPRIEGEFEPIERASANRRSLLSHANGKYLIFLDGDDYWIDDKKLQKQFDILEKNSDCVACGHPLMMRWQDRSQPDKLLGNLGGYRRK